MYMSGYKVAMGGLVGGRGKSNNYAKVNFKTINEDILYLL